MKFIFPDPMEFDVPKAEAVAKIPDVCKNLRLVFIFKINLSGK
jgi:hypothetical protein